MLVHQNYIHPDMCTVRSYMHAVKVKFQYREMVHSLTCVANGHFVNVVTAPCLLFPAPSIQLHSFNHVDYSPVSALIMQTCC